MFYSLLVSFASTLQIFSTKVNVYIPSILNLFPLLTKRRESESEREWESERVREKRDVLDKVYAVIFHLNLGRVKYLP